MRSSTSYTQDLVAPLEQVLNDGTTNLVYGLARIKRGTDTWHQHDGVGSVRAVLNGAGAVQSTTSYDPWGVPTTGSVDPFGFTGELHDGELVHLRARWYHPSTGTFTSRDPFAGFDTLPYSLHPYQYAYSNPVLWTDPSGRCVAGTPGCPTRENLVNTDRQWCKNGKDQTPGDGVDDCYIAQDTQRFWATFQQRVNANDAAYDRLLTGSTPPIAPGDNPLCKIKDANGNEGMRYLCNPFCTELDSQACCGVQVDTWFAAEIRNHWAWSASVSTWATIGGGVAGFAAGAVLGGRWVVLSGSVAVPSLVQSVVD